MRLWPFGKKPETRNAENPSHAITWSDVYGVSQSSTWPVTPEGAMKISAVLACVRVLAESVASLSWIAYERMETGGKRRASAHPVYRLLHDRPNRLMSSFTFRERMMADLLLQGNFYAFIDWRGSDIAGLWPLDPRKVQIRLTPDHRDVLYQVTAKGFVGEYRSEDILHVPALGDGVEGKSVISYNSRAFGIALAEDEYAGAFFQNGAYAGGVLQSQKALSKEARDRLRDGWSTAYNGAKGWHKVAVLEDGIEWRPMTINPRDAMLLQSRKFQVADIARMFRVPPHLIGDLDRATFSNIEHQSLEFVMHSLRPWLVRIEQEANHKLFTTQERDRMFCEFLLDSMLRGDIKSRNEAYSIMRQNGVLNADEWRERENMNPLPDEQGKKYLVQLNMQELSRIGEGDDQ